MFCKSVFKIYRFKNRLRGWIVNKYKFKNKFNECVICLFQKMI